MLCRITNKNTVYDDIFTGITDGVIHNIKAVYESHSSYTAFLLFFGCQIGFYFRLFHCCCKIRLIWKIFYTQFITDIDFSGQIAKPSTNPLVISLSVLLTILNGKVICLQIMSNKCTSKYANIL